MIFSKEYKKIAEAITRKTDHTLTILDYHGWYTGKEMKVICLLAKKRESVLIFRLIKMIDPRAFVSQRSVIGVYGEGFDQIKVKVKKEMENKNTESASQDPQSATQLPQSPTSNPSPVGRGGYAGYFLKRIKNQYFIINITQQICTTSQYILLPSLRGGARGGALRGGHGTPFFYSLRHQQQAQARRDTPHTRLVLKCCR